MGKDTTSISMVKNWKLVLKGAILYELLIILRTQGEMEKDKTVFCCFFLSC